MKQGEIDAKGMKKCEKTMTWVSPQDIQISNIAGYFSFLFFLLIRKHRP